MEKVMEKKFTPGPWKVAFQRATGGANGAWVKAGDLIVARIPMKADRPIYQKEADARPMTRPIPGQRRA